VSRGGNAVHWKTRTFCPAGCTEGGRAGRAYCYNAAWRRRGRGDDEIGEAELRALVDGLAAAGATAVSFTGGEPLLAPGLLAVAEHARALGLETSLLTNGTRLADRAGAVARRFDRVVAIQLAGRRAKQP
jgi:organic radical activating enzyme